MEELRNICKRRNLGQRTLFLKINKEIDIVTISSIYNDRQKITDKEIMIIDKYLNLTRPEKSSLENQKIDNQKIMFDLKLKLFIESIPINMEKGKEYIVEHKGCGGKITAMRNNLNGHLWAECNKCNISIIQ